VNKNALVHLIAETVDGYRLAMSGASEPVGPSTRLFGPSGVLDSLGLVSVLVEVEQRIADAGEGPVSVMDDRAMSQKHSPFATVDSLADYLAAQLAPKTSG
jgi:acyl carrier protein